MTCAVLFLRYTIFFSLLTLKVMDGDEVDTYWCFKGLMDKMVRFIRSFFHSLRMLTFLKTSLGCMSS